MNRHAIEAELLDHELEAVAAECHAADVSFPTWIYAPNMRGRILLAADRLARRIERDEGCSQTAARERAAFRIGIPPDTVRSWRRRWPLAAYRGALRASDPGAGGATLEHVPEPRRHHAAG